MQNGNKRKLIDSNDTIPNTNGKRSLVGKAEPLPVSPPENKPREQCGAKTRSGAPCANYAMKNGRCRMHGGTRKKGEKNAGAAKPGEKRAYKHGLYSAGLLDSEYDDYKKAVDALGTIDQELNMARIMNNRALTAQKHWLMVRGLIMDANDDYDSVHEIANRFNVLELDGIEKEQGDVVVGSGDNATLADAYKKKLKYKITDFRAEIAKYTRLIERLEKTRAELLGQSGGGEDFVRRVAEDLRDFNDNITELMPGGVVFGSEGEDDDGEQDS